MAAQATSHGFEIVDRHAVMVAGDAVDIRATMRSYEYGGEWVAVSVPALRGSGVNIIFVPARIVRGVKIDRAPWAPTYRHNGRPYED